MDPEVSLPYSEEPATMIRTLNRMNPFHILIPCFLKMHCIIILRSMAGCRRIDRKAYILGKDFGEKVRIYQQNYLQDI
jgi:hypothetical protein